MLNQAIAQANLPEVLASKENFHPIPRYEEREKWESLAPEALAYYDGIGHTLLGSAWPETPASLYMDFNRNGNRDRYEKLYFQRRSMLYSMLIAECIEGKGRLIDDIINGIWVICEESTWVLPAHSESLMNLEAPIDIDLFAAETASLLSWVYAIMGKRLAQVSPLIPRRIELEIDRRVITPYEKSDRFFWMGFAHNRPLNNWNPWINSNVLATVLNIEPDPNRRVTLLVKIGRSAQRFLDCYASDGGCDEGPGYFNRAGGALLDILALYEEATGGKVNLYSEELIRNIGKYIMYVHIADNWHVNFADAAAQVWPDAMMLWRTGIKTGQDDLVAYARGALAHGFAKVPYRVDREQGIIYRSLTNLFAYDPTAFAGASLVEAREHFFPGIQVVSARSSANSDEGMFLAVKGGHNDESHNHNDVGNYIIALDGAPIIADAGVGVYTKATFSAQRYEIWSMQSGYHNTAILNGCNQEHGKEFAATDVQCNTGDDRVTFSLDMASAYGSNAGVRQYLRTVTFDRETDCITVCDEAEFLRVDQPTVLPILSAVEPVLSEGLIQFRTGGRTLALHYDPAMFEVINESIALDDRKLYTNWQRDCLYRILMRRKEVLAKDRYSMRYCIES